jgi:hypothetical protein
MTSVSVTAVEFDETGISAQQKINIPYHPTTS